MNPKVLAPYRICVRLSNFNQLNMRKCDAWARSGNLFIDSLFTSTISLSKSPIARFDINDVCLCEPEEISFKLVCYIIILSKTFSTIKPLFVKHCIDTLKSLYIYSVYEYIEMLTNAHAHIARWNECFNICPMTMVLLLCSICS